ncbi:MAG: hypothetical protein LH477_09885 [Nocardioides sp.]|nr:hypothetical protein [Nocardioides sp.]
MSVDDRLREAFAVEPDAATDTVTALARVHVAARRARLLSRTMLVGAAATAVVAVVIGAAVIHHAENRTADPIVAPPSTSSATDPADPDLEDPGLEHHQGRWETRELTRADVERTLTELGRSAW